MTSAETLPPPARQVRDAHEIVRTIEYVFLPVREHEATFAGSGTSGRRRKGHEEFGRLFRAGRA